MSVESQNLDQADSQMQNTVEYDTDRDALFNELKVSISNLHQLSGERKLVDILKFLEHCRKWIVCRIPQPCGYRLPKNQLTSCTFKSAQSPTADTDLHVNNYFGWNREYWSFIGDTRLHWKWINSDWRLFHVITRFAQSEPWWE